MSDLLSDIAEDAKMQTVVEEDVGRELRNVAETEKDIESEDLNGDMRVAIRTLLEEVRLIRNDIEELKLRCACVVCLCAKCSGTNVGRMESHSRDLSEGMAGASAVGKGPSAFPDKSTVVFGRNVVHGASVYEGSRSDSGSTLVSNLADGSSGGDGSAAGSAAPKLKSCMSQSSLHVSGAKRVRFDGICKETAGGTSRVGVAGGELFRAGPFLVSQPLRNPIHLKLVLYAYDEELDWNETLVKTKYNELSRYQMRTLLPDTCLNGELINVACEFMTERERTTTFGKAEKWFLPTRMTSKSVGIASSVADFVARHKLREKFMGELKLCKTIYIPIHHNSHWVLFICHIESQVVEIWDSLLLDGKSTAECLVADVMSNLDDILCVDTSTERAPAQRLFGKFEKRVVKMAEQQTNSTDCGLHVLKNMETSVSRKITSHEERLSVALRLLLSPHNLSIEKVKENANRLKLLGDTLWGNTMKS